MTSLSLIVCTLGRTEPLRRLFASIRASTIKPHEILLIDQNPPGYLDAIVIEGADLPIARVTARPGLSRARNIGLDVASGDLLGFPDDDCWYPGDTLERVVEAFDSAPDVGIMSGRTADQDGHTSVSPHLPTGARIGRRNVFKVGNSNGIFVRREAALAVGGFDENLGVGSGSQFQSGEETDFLLRCLAAGTTGRFDPSIVVHHEQGSTLAARQIGRVKAYSAGYGRVLRKHGFGWTHLAVPVLRTSLRSLVCAARLDFPGAASRWAWAEGALRGFSATL